jgi:hypothetical protein
LLSVCCATTHLKVIEILLPLDSKSLTFIYSNQVRGISPRTTRTSNRLHPLTHPSLSRILGTASVRMVIAERPRPRATKIEHRVHMTFGYMVLGNYCTHQLSIIA